MRIPPASIQLASQLPFSSRTWRLPPSASTRRSIARTLPRVADPMIRTMDGDPARLEALVATGNDVFNALIFSSPPGFPLRSTSDSQLDLPAKKDVIEEHHHTTEILTRSPAISLFPNAIRHCDDIYQPIRYVAMSVRPLDEPPCLTILPVAREPSPMVYRAVHSGVAGALFLVIFGQAPLQEPSGALPAKPRAVRDSPWRIRPIGHDGLLQRSSAATGWITPIISASCCGQTWWIAVISTSAPSTSSNPLFSRLFTPSITPSGGIAVDGPAQLRREGLDYRHGVAGLAWATAELLSTALAPITAAQRTVFLITATPFVCAERSASFSSSGTAGRSLSLEFASRSFEISSPSDGS